MAKGKIHLIGKTQGDNLPIWEVTTPKWKRRIYGRIVRRYGGGFPIRAFRTETVVGNEPGEKCSYYAALSAIRFGDRIGWDKL